VPVSQSKVLAHCILDTASWNPGTRPNVVFLSTSRQLQGQELKTNQGYFVPHSLQSVTRNQQGIQRYVTNIAKKHSQIT
jgi:hypothetical protein